jgi:thiamine-monophosphate kinase
VVGGDVVRSTAMFISVAMVGAQANGEDEMTIRPMTRSGAKPGDVIAVTGPLGGSAGGLRLLMSGASPDGPEATLIRAHRRPEPSVATGVWLAANGVACAVDISDGLTADLGRVCRASNAAAIIQLADLPVEPELKAAFPDDWPEMALGGGEGYQLLFAAPAKVVEVARTMNPAITPIGEIVAGEPQVTVLDKNGEQVKPSSAGHDHFPKP